MPFDRILAEQIEIWRHRAADYQALAKAAPSDHERDAYLTIADSYEALIRSQLELREETDDESTRGSRH